MENCKLYVGNLHQSVTEGDIINIFTKYGTVKNVRYFWHKFGPNRGQPQGFCFVEMSSTLEVEECIKKLHKKLVKGRNINVRIFDNTADSSSSTDSSSNDTATTTTTGGGVYNNNGKRRALNSYSSSSSSSFPNKVIRRGISIILPGEKHKSARDIEEEINRLQVSLRKKPSH